LRPAPCFRSTPCRRGAQLRHRPYAVQASSDTRLWILSSLSTSDRALLDVLQR
jgi:hypothetical protein